MTGLSTAGSIAESVFAAGYVGTWECRYLQVDRVEGVEVMAAGQTAADLVGGPQLVAHGSGWDTSGAWRHAGDFACCCKGFRVSFLQWHLETQPVTFHWGHASDLSSD